MKRRTFIVLAAVVALVLASGVFWAFGTPQAPNPPTSVTGSGSPPVEAAPPDVGVPASGAPGGMGMPSMGGGDPAARGKEAPPADPDSPLAIEIPGCVCHSDDPKIVEEHASYRMNQCFGCHSR